MLGQLRVVEVAQKATRYSRSILLVLLPFAAGYFLSYFYRTINAVISAELSSTMQLRASDLGLLTAVYFLSFAAIQLPLGVALDRYGPRRVQGVLLLVAAIGAALFGSAQTLAGFIIGRALIGLGVAAALIAGLKSIRLWFPKERLPLLNGCFIMLGTLGALTATVPAELIVAWIGWRALFAGLAAATAGCAVMIMVLSPESIGIGSQSGHGLASLKKIYTNQRFWRLAPLSTMCISTAWALQGLWAAPWLADVENLGRPEIVHHLFVMAPRLFWRTLRRRRQRSRRGCAVHCRRAMLAPAGAILSRLGDRRQRGGNVLSFTLFAEYFPSRRQRTPP